MTKFGRYPALLIFALFLTTLSCDGVLEVAEVDTRVTVELSGSELQVVDHVKLDESTLSTEVQDDGGPHQHHVSDTVHYAFHPSDGGPVIRGEVPDSRLLISEFDENGDPDPIQVVASDGLFEFDVPGVRGRLELRSNSGEIIGETVFDPTSAVTRQSELLSDADLLGPTVKIVNNGSRTEKIDILFVPEGYSSGEMSSFHNHVNSIVSGVRQKPVFRDVWSGFNVLRQDVRSRSRTIGSGGRPNDTAFETASGISGVERCVFFSNSRGQRAAERLRDRVGADVVIVLVNRTTTGACARDGVIVTSRPRHVTETVAHELGHALFGLADEYATSRPGGYCSTGPNVARSVSSLPWSDMVTTPRLPTPISAQRGTIGAFEGAGYCSSGRYRPTHDCLMRTLGKNLCPVCEREIERKMARYLGGSGGSGGSTSTGGTGGSSTGSTGTSSSIAAPRGLSPDSVEVDAAEVRLDWGRVSGASKYKLTVDRRVSGSWRQFAEFETDRDAVTIRVRADGGTYRWNVRACTSSVCSTTSSATFVYDPDGSTGSTTGSNTGSTSTGSTSLAAPTGLSPARSSVVSDGTPSLSWSSVSGASHYMFRMVSHDGNRWSQYVPEQSVDATRVRTTLRTPERWYAFSVAACDARGCSAWTDYSTLYYRP